MCVNCIHRVYCSSPTWCMSMVSCGGMILTGENGRTRRKVCPSVTLYTTKPTWNEPGTNPGLRFERPATNCVNHGTTFRIDWMRTYCLDAFVSCWYDVGLSLCADSRFLVCKYWPQTEVFTTTYIAETCVLLETNLLHRGCNSEERLRFTCHYKDMHCRSVSTSHRTVAPEAGEDELEGETGQRIYLPRLC
jgi:hypothetical protein